ncbi:hypothetical protein ACTFIU_000789 [Dictyostelium citrinum]
MSDFPDYNTTALFVCDAQKYYLDRVKGIDSLIKNIKSLIDSCKELGIKTFMTKHNPSVNDEIIEELEPSNHTVFEKTLYSMYTKEFKKHIDELYNSNEKDTTNHLKTVILAGFETHVCIVQTAFDLLREGYIVHVIVDATASINDIEKTMSLKRLKQSGVFLTTTEAISLQLLRDDANPKSSKKKMSDFPDYNTTALFICDAQKYYLDTLGEVDVPVRNIKCLIDSCKELGIKTFMTKHNPSVYDEIIEELEPSNHTVFEKTLYSMYTKEFKKHIDELYNSNEKDTSNYLKTVILTGFETHVCIVQTAFDLLREGYIVHVIVDATASINDIEYIASLKRLKQAGVYLTTTEAILFQLLRDDANPKSSKVIELITNRSISLLSYHREDEYGYFVILILSIVPFSHLRQSSVGLKLPVTTKRLSMKRISLLFNAYSHCSYSLFLKYENNGTCLISMVCALV